MAPRFFSSPYKNAIASPAKNELQWSELPVAMAAHSDNSDLIKTCSEYWLAQGSSSGHLVCLQYDQTGKFNSHAPGIQLSSRSITEFDVSRFDDLLVAGFEDGKITLHKLPSYSDIASASPSALISSPVTTLIHPSAHFISSLCFHPTTSSLVLASAGNTVAIYDVSPMDNATEPIFTIELQSEIWCARWSTDGRSVSTSSKDGFLRVYDIRSSTTSPTLEVLAHGGVKCCRHVWLSGQKIFSTGFSKTRDREYSLYDLTQGSGKAIKTQRIDSNTGVLMPFADTSRNIVYFAGKGDMTLRWVEVGGPSIFTEGGSPINSQIISLALVPPSQLRLMKAEINRVLVLSKGSVIPIEVQVPRRQYIDFHSELFPPIYARVPAQDAAQWRKGGDELCQTIEQSPDGIRQLAADASAAHQVAKQNGSLPISSLPSVPISEKPVPEEMAIQTKSLSKDRKADSLALPDSGSPGTTSEKTAFSSIATDNIHKHLVPSSHGNPEEALAIRSHNDVKPSTTLSEQQGTKPRWSRKLLAGKTALKPAYYDVQGASVTMKAEVQLLKANKLFFFFPQSGPGGRLAIHSRSMKGRLPTSITSIVAGASIMDFELSPFDPYFVYIASEDSTIRMFEIPKDGLTDAMDTPARTFTDPKLDKITELKHHPIVKNLLLSTSTEQGSSTIRLWDTYSGQSLASIPIPVTEISSVAWSPSGSLIAVGTKAKTLFVMDPRNPSSLLKTECHDSVRPARVVWATNRHVLSSGFSRSATREVVLLGLDNAATSFIKPVKQTLDVSPGQLFPFYDIDTDILLLYSRGERTCHAFEVQPDTPVPFTKLPSFELGTLQSAYAFLPKSENDVSAVEVIKALRLTLSHTVEEISFLIPRAKMEYFQDDIFIPTKDSTTATNTAEEWMAGIDKELNISDLKPKNMISLSVAPMVKNTVSTRSQITGPILTESQRNEAYLERLFAAAKVDEDDEQSTGPKHAPIEDDDDW